MTRDVSDRAARGRGSPTRRAAIVLGATSATILAGAAAFILFGPHYRGGPVPVRAFAADLPGRIAADQRYLTQAPGDATVWAELGIGYVEQARRTGDAAYYPKAEQALRESLRLQPETNDTALVGMAALTGARRDFAGSRDWATRATTANPRNPLAHGLLSDAYLQLGDTRRADGELQKMLEAKPGVASFTRAAELYRLRNERDRAAQALNLALDSAVGSADLADVRSRLGDLAWDSGWPNRSLRAYDLALRAEPGHPDALAGRARALAALHREDEALTAYAAAVARHPRPQTLLEYGELYQSLGRTGEAQAQYRGVRGALSQLAAKGVVDDLVAGRFEADHGDPAVAVTRLAREWKRRPNDEVADAYAWALHRAGRNQEAIKYARQNTALAAYHRGEIERALGREADAERSRARALKLNPHFSPLYAQEVADGR
ncbi:tetratricopeptide repeat protein [Acrocarpospora catenulata]|uniref:tetratricopeptide repeat protein n=1 Tax=Acrocarpospora catenulata TaxID=2836182 RepID=UPI001BDA30B8|nr:hypothetical protein [Acrocarpospora catenulata]